jgi:hypothetical protein
MQRSGFADLPLHGGHVPAWLAERMTSLATAIVENVALDYGTSELLSRLSDPFWFQALGCPPPRFSPRLDAKPLRTSAPSPRSGFDFL